MHNLEEELQELITILRDGLAPVVASAVSRTGTVHRDNDWQDFSTSISQATAENEGKQYIPWAYEYVSRYSQVPVTKMHARYDPPPPVLRKEAEAKYFYSGQGRSRNRAVRKDVRSRRFSQV